MVEFRTCGLMACLLQSLNAVQDATRVFNTAVFLFAAWNMALKCEDAHGMMREFYVLCRQVSLNPDCFIRVGCTQVRADWAFCVQTMRNIGTVSASRLFQLSTLLADDAESLMRQRTCLLMAAVASLKLGRDSGDKALQVRLTQPIALSVEGGHGWGFRKHSEVTEGPICKKESEMYQKPKCARVRKWSAVT